MKSCRQTASISAKDAEVGGDTGLTAHIEPYCGEDWPVSTNGYNSFFDVPDIYRKGPDIKAFPSPPDRTEKRKEENELQVLD